MKYNSTFSEKLIIPLLIASGAGLREVKDVFSELAPLRKKALRKGYLVLNPIKGREVHM